MCQAPATCFTLVILIRTWQTKFINISILSVKNRGCERTQWSKAHGWLLNMNINRRVGRSRTCFRKRGWHVILGNENVLYRCRSRWGRDARPCFMLSGSSGIPWRQSVETQGWRNAGFVCKNRDHGIRRRSAGEQCWDSDCHSMEDALSWAGTGQGVRKRREGAESWSCWAGYRRPRIGRCQWLPGFQMCYQLVSGTIHTQSPLWQYSCCCSSWGGLGSCEGRDMTQSALGHHPWNICLPGFWTELYPRQSHF